MNKQKSLQTMKTNICVGGPSPGLADEKIAPLKRAVFRQIDQGSQRRQLHR